MQEINGYPGYFVTPEGRVYSNRKYSHNPKGELREKKQWSSQKGYKMVTLGKAKKFKVHRLVALAYIPNPNNYDTINHINEDKTDNRVENLEWMSNRDNVVYSMGKSFIIENKNGDKFEVFNLRKWCRDNNVSSGHIYDTCTGKSEWLKGYRLVSIHELSPEDRRARARAAILSSQPEEG